MAALELRDGDSVTIADNGPRTRGAVRRVGEIAAIDASGLRSSYYARNQGAAFSSAQWILFLDADAEPPPDLIDRYFDPAPGRTVGLLAGGIRDACGPGWTGRYTALKGAMNHQSTLGRGRWAYAMTANAMVRRDAFEQAGGFRDDIRSGGDADLCFRLRALAWKLEARPGADVVHHGPRTLAGLMQKRVRHGAGAAWLEAQYPGFWPSTPPRDLARWSAQRLRAAAAAGRRQDLDAALVACVEPVEHWALALGRMLPNRVGRLGRRA